MKRVATIVIAIIALAISISVLTSASTHGQGQPHPIGFTPPIHTQSAGQMSAIHPSAAKVQAQALPTFSTADVEQYIKTDPFIGEVASSLKLRHTITFMSSQELGTKLHEDLSGGSSILCYVEYQGNAPFDISSVRTPPGAPRPLFTKAYEVFDSRTGNLIEWGGMK